MNLEELAENVSVADVIRIVNYVKQYFVIPEKDQTAYIIKGIIKLKEMFDLDSSHPKINEQTLSILDFHRCGVPDSLVENATHDYNRFKPGMTVKWYVDSYINGLTKTEQVDIFASVYKMYSSLINLNFEQTTNSNNANIIIRSSSRGNGLGQQSGTLAYAYLAPERDFTGQLELVLDLAEIWIKDANKRGILLYNVFAHESGHNWGLSHSNVKTALMAPYYSANVCCPVENDDLPRLLSLYGKAKEQPVSPPIIPTNPPNNGGVDNSTPNGTISIQIEGKISKIAIPGYRISKVAE